VSRHRKDHRLDGLSKFWADFVRGLSSYRYSAAWLVKEPAMIQFLSIMTILFAVSVVGYWSGW
jgi:hypothetical protein